MKRIKCNLFLFTYHRGELLLEKMLHLAPKTGNLFQFQYLLAHSE